MSPRDLLAEGQQPLFGRTPTAEWVNATSDDHRVQLRAAQIQHEAAVRFRTHLRAKRETVGQFADRRHLNAESVRRKLRGESWANLRDLALWELETGRDES